MASQKHSQKKQGFQINFLNNSLVARILSLVLIVFGSALVFFASLSYSNLDINHPFITKPEAEVTQGNQPVKLFIPKLSKTLNVTRGEAVNNRWTISPTGVSYLTDSALPGTVGNSVIYGHNLASILGDLSSLTNEDKIYVLLSNGSFVKYTVSEEKEISPYQVEILSQTPDSRLTIFTCSGFLDTARFVVIAKETKNG